jgi:SAF domain
MKYVLLTLVTFCMRVAGLPHIEHRDKPLAVVNPYTAVIGHKALKQLPAGEQIHRSDISK